MYRKIFFLLIVLLFSVSIVSASDFAEGKVGLMMMDHDFYELADVDYIDYKHSLSNDKSLLIFENSSSATVTFYFMNGHTSDGYLKEGYVSKSLNNTNGYFLDNNTNYKFIYDYDDYIIMIDSPDKDLLEELII